MHELSIALEIIDILNGEITRRKIRGIDEVGLRIGMLTGVDPDSLEFGFKAATMDSPLSDVELNIRLIPIGGICRKCRACFTVEDFVILCPECGSTEVDITQGEELDIEYIVEHDSSSG